LEKALRALGQAIHEIRMERELTQEELALRIGFHESYISVLESGRRNPRWGAVRSVARGLEIPLAELARRAEEIERKL
jgi:transcriptional regulator with XRE-family HTH domain